MKTRALFLSAIMLLLAPGLSNAQFGNMIRNKASKVINAGTRTFNKEVDKKVDSAATKKTQEELDKANQNIEQNNEQNQQAAQPEGNQSGNQGSRGFNLGSIMGGKVTSKYNDSYSFNSRIYMQMEMYDKKDKVTKMDYFIYFTEASPVAGIETKIEGTSEEGNQVAMNSSMITDGVNKSFIILSDINGMKMGIISAIPDETTTEGQAADNSPKVVITKTGKSKVIAGYKCNEYTYSDVSTKKHGSIWATKDLKLNADRRTFSKSGMPSYYDNPDLQNSVALSIEQYNDKNELEVKSDTKEINLNYSHTISTAGYGMRQMNFNQTGGQQKK